MNPPTEPFAPLSVLIVDDDEDTALSMAEVLNLYGFSARAALCGCEVLNLVKLDPPDVVFWTW